MGESKHVGANERQQRSLGPLPIFSGLSYGAGRTGAGSGARCDHRVANGPRAAKLA